MKITVLGIDLAKNVLQLHGVDAQGNVGVRKQLARSKLLPFIAQLTPCRMGMEACQGAHDWAREMRKLGHDVRLISPPFVTPYRQSHKNDPNDAAAICEAVSRPHMRFVPIKEVAHQDVQALHRARQLLIKQRTALCNQVRGLLSEYGGGGGSGCAAATHESAQPPRRRGQRADVCESGAISGALSAIGLVGRTHRGDGRQDAPGVHDHCAVPALGRY
jgi:transposase